MSVTANSKRRPSSVRFYIDGKRHALTTASLASLAVRNVGGYFDSTTVADGTHVFKIVAQPSAGSGSVTSSVSASVSNSATAESASRRWRPPPTPDTTAPSAPSALAASGVTATGATISWNASTDNVGVARYDVYKAGVMQGSVTGTNFGVSLTCATTSAITVTAVDAAGNSATSSPLNVKAAACPTPPPTVDSTAPSAPTGLAASAITQTSAQLSWNPSTDNVGIASYDIDKNGVWSDWSAGTTYTMSGLTCGTAYSAYIVALDQANNYAAGNTITFTTSPCVVTPPPADTTAPSAPSSLSATGITQTAANIGWTASTDNVGVTRYDVYKGGVLQGSSTTTGFAAALTCGTTSVFTVTAVDAAGNSATSSPLNVTASACPVTPPPADTTAPSAPTGLSATGVTGTAATIKWTASTDNVGVTRYDVYKAGAKQGSATTTSYAATLTCGTTSSFTVSANDAAGNSATSAAMNVTASACPPPADTTAPSAPSGLSATSITQTGATVNWTASTDNVGVVRYDVYQGGIKQGSSTTTSFGVSLSCGATSTVTVTAADAAGNTATSSPMNVTASACPISTSPSGVAMPTGDVTGWHQIFADDFTKDAALGTMGSVSDANAITYTGSTGTKWVTYPTTYTDTYQHRPYRADQVMSVHDGTMDFYLHNVNGQPAGANPSPMITGSSQYQTYGRYSARLKVDSTDLSEYYMAWLLWPSDEASWESAESDFPEGGLASGNHGFGGFNHVGPGSQEAFSTSGIDIHDWHTYTQEWTPTVRRYYVDGNLIHTSTHAVFSGPERWQLQTETNGSGTHAGHLLVDWVAVYGYAGG